MKKEEKQLHKAVEEAFTMAESAFNSEGGFQTMVLVDFEGKRSLGVPLVSEDLVDARREIILGLGSFAAMAESLGLLGAPTSVRMMSEAWMAVPKSTGAFLRPSEDPNKRETLIACGSNSSGYQAHRMKEIVRSIKEVNGEMEEVVELVEPDDLPAPKNPAPGEIGYANILELYWDGYKATKERIEEVGDVSEVVSVKEEIGDSEENKKDALVSLMGNIMGAAMKAHEENKNDSNKS